MSSPFLFARQKPFKDVKTGQGVPVPPNAKQASQKKRERLYNGLVVAWCDYPREQGTDMQVPFLQAGGSIPNCPKGADLMSSPKF